MPREKNQENNKFKEFATILSSNKTNPTAAEIAVQQTPFLTKEGSFFNSTLAIIDRALYNPNKETKTFSTTNKTDNDIKTYTKYQFLNSSINKVETFFEDVNYDINIGNIDISRCLNPNWTVGSNIDVLGNFGINATKSYNKIQFRGAIQYKPTEHEGRFHFNFTNGIVDTSANVYINNYNPGIATNFTQKLNFNSNIGAGISVFKENTNTYVKYEHKNAAVSAYGSLSKSPYFGVSAKITY